MDNYFKGILYKYGAEAVYVETSNNGYAHLSFYISGISFRIVAKTTCSEDDIKSMIKYQLDVEIKRSAESYIRIMERREKIFTTIGIKKKRKLLKWIK